MDGYTWADDAARVDMAELSNLYKIAPLGDKPPEALRTVFGNSMFSSCRRNSLPARLPARFRFLHGET